MLVKQDTGAKKPQDQRKGIVPLRECPHLGTGSQRHLPPDSAARFPDWAASTTDPEVFIMKLCSSRLSAAILLASTLTFAGVTDDVRDRLARNDFAAAEAQLQSYRARQGVTPDYLEALSGMARAHLAAQQVDRATTYAKQAESLSRQLLLKRPLDAEPHLPLALGAALEVEAQALAARGQQAQAVALLRRGLVTYRNTSIRPRLEKNLIPRPCRPTGAGRCRLL